MLGVVLRTQLEPPAPTTFIRIHRLGCNRSRVGIALSREIG